MNHARIGIAGIGLIGGSIALRARTRGARIVACDRDPHALERARARGAIDDIAPDLAGLATSVDLLVLALPVDATVAALATLESLGGEGPQLILDVASVKAPIAAAGAALAHFVPTHPLAGSERGGIEGADGDLFMGATWTYDGAGRDAERCAATCAFIEAMGANPLDIPSAEHDALVAVTSHLPQALSVALGTTLARAVQRDSRALALCGPGMRSMLRLARSPAAIWEPIVAANRTALAASIRGLCSELSVIAEQLDAGEVAPLMSYFEDAGRISSALEERFAVRNR